MRNARASSIVVLLLIASGCGNSNSASLQPPAANVTGTWQLVDTPATTNCPDGLGPTLTYALTATEEAGSNTVTLSGTPVGTVTGTISGTQMSFSGSAPAQALGCTLLSSTVDLTLDSTGNKATGTSSWTCSYTGGSCSGTDSVVVTR